MLYCKQQVNILFRKGDTDEFKMNLELISVLKSFDWVFVIMNAQMPLIKYS